MSESDRSADSFLRRRRVWVVLTVLYGAFFVWYTPLGGPLSAEEIAHYESVLRGMGRDEAAFASWAAFMRSDTGDDFAMFNALDLADAPKPVEGVEPGESAARVMARYVQPFFAQAAPNAAHPVLIGWAAAPAVDLWGIEDAERWDQGGVVRYRSRRDVMNQIESIQRLARETGEQIHEYKIAALEKTIAFPLDPWFHLGDPRLVLGLLFLVIGLATDVRRLSRRASAGSAT